MSFPQTIFTTFSSQEHTANTVNKSNWPLGQLMEYEDGRKFRYMLAGATTLVAGQLNQGKVLVSGDVDNVAQAAWAVGATSGTITSTTSTAAAYYDGGWMGINKDPGGAYIYRVKTQVLWASTTETIVLDPDSPIAVALTTTSETAFSPNPYNGVVVCPITTVTGQIVGLTAAPVTNAQYGWVQSGGIAMGNAAASTVVGNNASAILAAEGRGIGVGNADIDLTIGVVLTIASTGGEFGMVDLHID